MRPILALLFGAFNAELLIVAAWWPLQRPPADGSKLALYFEGAVAHYLTLASVLMMFGFLWHPDVGGIDLLFEHIPAAWRGDWFNTGSPIPYTLRVGALAGFLLSFRVGKIAGAIRSRFGAEPAVESAP